MKDALLTQVHEKRDLFENVGNWFQMFGGGFVAAVILFEFFRELHRLIHH